MPPPNAWSLRRAVRILRAGGVVAYPTEAVYGLGCDPFDEAAILRLLAIKGRAMDKGLILIAADHDQLAPLQAAGQPGVERHRAPAPGSCPPPPASRRGSPATATASRCG